MNATNIKTITYKESYGNSPSWLPWTPKKSVNNGDGNIIACKETGSIPEFYNASINGLNNSYYVGDTMELSPTYSASSGVDDYDIEYVWEKYTNEKW